MPKQKHLETEKKEEAVQEELVIEQAAEKEETGVVISKALDDWIPKTELGKRVKNNEISDIKEILEQGKTILEAEIVDKLVPGLEQELLSVGQSKGKFGGGKKSIWKQTQKKTKEGNKPKFSTLVVVGNRNGYVGMGYGSSKETVPAREKAVRKAKISLIMIKRGCGEWACGCGTPHTIPFKVYGRCGSCRIYLMPAPKGTGLKIESECKKIMELVGIRDIHSKTFGQTRSRLNLVMACFEALRKLTKMKSNKQFEEMSGVVEGAI